ncbi:ATP synthase subunit I [Aneurinibacillus sp. REN35]|uniref:ATP synthase subunit I n=1 Tax=Aneurinibacillus sp. REN35 TaxID=3237286 RepID=UPI0035277F15
MEPFASSIKHIARYIFLLFTAVVLLWLFMPQRVFFQGLILGMLVSMANGFILYVKTLQAGEAAITPGKKLRGIGMLPRFLLAGFSVYVSFKLPHMFSFYGVVIGLMVVPVMTLLFAIFQYLLIKK